MNGSQFFLATLLLKSAFLLFLISTFLFWPNLISSPTTQHQQPAGASGRKLTTSKLDSSKTSGLEIDPRYGVEKRLVPTGPNPLHH
ncbi:hypothetical protein ZOSMA_99G00760 [Zostera marina]|uniref:Uncharacterized protein n=1 Tax=Zostera marina TaxID=29655 RepID=A0A0K9NJL4_ZOSMR|nr:hypothetical protein ZOSMA_99G00760 [Zostera marina]